jgi:cellobiose epimerase
VPQAFLYLKRQRLRLNNPQKTSRSPGKLYLYLLTKHFPSMTRLSAPLLLFTFIFALTCCAPSARQDSAAWADREQIANEMEASLKNDLLLKFYPHNLDREYGGFLTGFTHDWQPKGPHDKMIVSQARYVWTPSKAARLYPDEPMYREAAAHGAAFLRDVMWDKTHGGFYTLVTREGEPKNPETKTAYGNAFGIYALAAYYGLSRDTSALNLAQKAFHWLERGSHDPVHKGYFQNLDRQGRPLSPGAGVKGPVPNPQLRYKDQNSSIHLLEAFTELYSVWPDPLVRERLEEMMLLIRDTIVTDKGYLTLFLTPEWQPVSYRDSTEEARKAHRNIDHVSFGHDVETAFLLLEASHALGRENDGTTATITKKMVDHALDKGWDDTVGGFYDMGYYFRDQDDIAIIHEGKNWWTQVEGLNTLLLMAELYPDDPRGYYGKFQKQWDYVKTYLIDPEHGGYFDSGMDNEPDHRTRDKAHAWKANYHESRSLMHCIERLRDGHDSHGKQAGVVQRK